MMKKIHKMAYLILSLLLLAVFPAGCAPGEEAAASTEADAPEENEIQLYYLNADGDGFHTVDYTLENTEDALLASYEVVSRLSDTENRSTDTYKPAISDGVIVNSIVLDGAEETVDLGAGYRQLNAADAILLRAAVVESLVQISGVDSVRFTINGDSLLDSEDTPIGAMTADTFILEEDAEAIYGTEERVTLYYADMDGDSLVEYKTSLHADENMPMETRVLLELMHAPEELDVQSPLPTDLIINQTQIHNSVCYVDLSRDIENVLPGVEEKVMVYAMVNTITALGNATSVQFTVEGERMESLRDFDSFHLMMTNDYSLVDSSISGSEK